MKRYKMPKNRREYEFYMLNAFMMGMNCGYAVEHTELSNEERIYRERFKALIQGKINSINDIIDNDALFIERNSGQVKWQEKTINLTNLTEGNLHP